MNFLQFVARETDMSFLQFVAIVFTLGFLAGCVFSMLVVGVVHG